MTDISWIVGVRGTVEHGHILDDSRRSGDETTTSLALTDVIRSLVEQTTAAVPEGAECKVELGGQVERVGEEQVGVGVKWVFELSLGGKTVVTEESNFRLRVRFRTNPPGS